MNEFEFTLEKWDQCDDYSYRPDWDYIVVVTPEFTGDEEDLLSLSIKKWEFIVSVLREQPRIEISGGGQTTCALCAKYFDTWGDCSGCPVKEATGRAGCVETPYRLWATDYSLAAAQAELEFLRSLKDGEQ